jgi:hypothetical protein
LKVHLNIILPFTSGSSKWFFTSGFPTNPLSSPYAPHAPPISFFSISPPAQYWVRNTDHSAPHHVPFNHSPVTSSLLCPNILLNTLFSNTLSLRSPLNVSDQVSHPYKTSAELNSQK